MANPRRVFISGQKRGVFGVIKRELRRRSAIEPVIGHMNTDGHFKTDGISAAVTSKAATAMLSTSPQRRRPQPSPRPRLAEDPIAPNPDRPGACLPSNAQSKRLLNGQLVLLSQKVAGVFESEPATRRTQARGF
jgi:hypothetical protein